MPVVVACCVCAETLQDGASALLELAKKVNATSPVEAQPQQPQKSVYLVRVQQGLLVCFMRGWYMGQTWERSMVVVCLADACKGDCRRLCCLLSCGNLQPSAWAAAAVGVLQPLSARMR
jgi:hypothetical protein